MQVSKITSILNRSLSLLYSSLFVVTPLLVYHKTSELFEFNKMLFIYLVTGLVASIWISKMLYSRKIILKKTPIDLFILLFVLSQILSTVFSFDHHTSLFGYYGRFNGGLLSTFSYVVLFYGFVSNRVEVFTREWVLRLMKTSIFTSIFVVLWGLTGWFGFDASCALFTGAVNNSCWTADFKPALRMFSTLGQPNWLGAYSAVNLSFCLYFLTKKFEKVKLSFSPSLLWWTTSLFLLYASVFATKSRSAILATLISTAIFTGCLYLKKSSETKEKSQAFLKLFAYVGVIAITALLVFKTGIPVVDRIIRPFEGKSAVVTEKESENVTELFISKSSDIRRIVWEGAVKIGLANPIFGTGVETFGYSYYFKRPASHNDTSEWDYLYNRAHNEYLNYFATSGSSGLISYLLLIGSVLYLSLRHYQKNKNLLTVSLSSGFVALLITNFFGFATSTSSLFFFMIPAFMLVSETPQKVEEEDERENEVRPVFFLLPLCIGLITILFVTSYFQADKNYTLGTAYLDSQDFTTSITYLERALSYKYEHVYEDKLAYAIAQAALVSHLDQNESDDKTSDKLIVLARDYNKKTIQASSKNILYYKTASKIDFLAFQITGDGNDFQKSIDDLNRAEDLAPTEPKIPYTKALFYSSYYDQVKDKALQKTLSDEAILEVDQAIKLKKNYRDAYFLKGTMQAKFGDVEGARETFEHALKVSPGDLEITQELEKL